MNDDDRAAIGQRTRENFEKHYQWHMSGAKWEAIFDSFEEMPLEQTWASPPRIAQPAPKLPEEQIHRADPSQLAGWLITEALRDPRKLNTFFQARLTRDLTYRTATSSTGGMYFNESSAAFDGMNQRQFFDYNVAYDQMVNLCQRRNNWEQQRLNVMRQRGIMQ
jgi:hypothetical protein